MMDYTIAMQRASRFAPILLTALLPFSANAATLSLDPAAASYGPGDTFIASVRITPGEECMNAAQVEIAYPPSELRAVDVARGNSILSLWVGDPKIDNTAGRISFSGGIPAGYCGHIPGDPAQSNILGQVVFTVLKTDASSAAVHILPTSAVYLNDGRGTKDAVAVHDAAYTLRASPTQSSNPWVDELLADTTPPEPFTVQVESTKDVFGGAYFAVFSTVDKQSGMDHYEILENGVWGKVTSPHVLADQTIHSPIQVKAIDKAGNVRIGTYNASVTPPRAAGSALPNVLFILGLICVLLALHWLWERRIAERARLQP